MPHAFSIYQELSKNGEKSYEGLPTDSCAVTGHEQADNFRRFLKRYLKGYVLDIGCGPQDVPLYLEGYDLDKIYGLDPMLPYDHHPFEFEQGIGEFIPWNDNSFDCVIFATSFDHVFLIDKVLSEVRRVLHDDGMVLFWMGFSKNAPIYNPYADNFKPVDQYHMFHYTKNQFEADMSFYFDKVECFGIDEMTHMYAYKVKGSGAE